MTIVTRFPTANELGGDLGWQTPDNAHADDDVLATGTAFQISLTNWKSFGFDAVIPVGATIKAVKVIIEHGAEEGSSFSVTIVGGVTHTARNFTQRAAISPRVVDTNDHTADRAWTRDDLLDANFKVNLQGSEADGAGDFPVLDYVKVEVTYTYIPPFYSSGLL